MVDKAQLIGQIRFALEQLSERNAQHDWEHLCRHLARERLCSNILPATGPVQAGGDQGRDFETFRTYLERNPLASRSFVGLISERPLVFACTLEKRINAKVRADVTTIMTSGVPVEGIYVFSSRAVPVKTRHVLIDWARDSYGVHLEILDAHAIAELLASHETFWIAERFLELPAALLPAPSEEPTDWYARALDKWRRATRPAVTFAEVTEIRAAARGALGPFAYAEDGGPLTQYQRPELPFWIERLDDAAQHAVADMLRRRAFYEASVLRLRGLGTLIGQEEHLRVYFARLPLLEDAAELEDAEVLLNYLYTACRRGYVGLDRSEIERLYEQLERRLDERLAAAEQHRRVNERCALLEIRGHVALFRTLMRGVPNAAAALEYWHLLAATAVTAPLFPLERFADRLAEYARFIGTHPLYAPLTEAVDSLVAKRFGQAKAADKCMERARAFRQAGNLPRAMAQLHRAKINWFAEETLGRTLVALRWLSQAYAEQDLFVAAKYYALAAAFVALHARDDRLKATLADSLEGAGDCDYVLGAWHGFLEFADVAASCYPLFVRDPDADAADPQSPVNRLLFSLGMVSVTTQLLHAELLPFVEQACVQVADRLGIPDVYEEVRSVAERAWADPPMEKLRAAITEQLAGAPWSDAGPVRRVEWTAHGVRWQAQWENTFEMTVAAEEFMSALQIILSDLVGYDLCLMRSTVRMALRLQPERQVVLSARASAENFDVTFEPSNEERVALVTLPPSRAFRDGTLSYDDLQVGAMSVASALLSEVSLLPTDRYHEILEERLAQGLKGKLHVGAPYGQCFRAFVSKDVFDVSARCAHPPCGVFAPFVSGRPEPLPWLSGPGPEYSSEAAHEQLGNRYERFARPICHTIRRLAAEPLFQQTLTRLRTEGWKDWHVLVAIFHITINYRIDHRRIALPTAAAEEAANQRLLSELEREDAMPVPLAECREENLRTQIKTFQVSFARTWGLEIHQYTPDFAALDDFLTHRYNFWRDDVEHDERLFASDPA